MIKTQLIMKISAAKRYKIHNLEKYKKLIKSYKLETKSEL